MNILNMSMFIMNILNMRLSMFIMNISNRIIWTNLLWKFPQPPCCRRAPHPSPVATTTIVVVVVAPFRNNFNPTLLIIGQTRKMISIPLFNNWPDEKIISITLFDNWPDKKTKRSPFIRCKLKNKRQQAGGQPEHGQTNETVSYKKKHLLRSTESLDKISGTFLLHLHQHRLASSLVSKILVSSCATS